MVWLDKAEISWISQNKRPGLGEGEECKGYLIAIWEWAPDSGIKGKLCLYFQFIKKYYSNIFW